MSVYDTLGPRSGYVNTEAKVRMRPRLHVQGPALLRDNPTRKRSEIEFVDLAFRTITLDAGALSGGGELTPWAQGLSNADLIRLDTSVSDIVVVGFADAIPVGGGYYNVQAVPTKSIKFIANVGDHTVELRPPAELLEDPDTAGIFIDNLTLQPDAVCRVCWDAVSYGYRIIGGNHNYIVYEGQYVVHEGRRIYLRT